MKKIFMMLAMLCSFSISYSCDICGSNMSNYNPNLFPQLNKNFIGINFQHRSYKLSNGHIESLQQLNSYTITAQVGFLKKLQLLASVPFQQSRLANTNARSKLNGLGDATIILNYKLWQQNTIGKKQALIIGGGVKLPSGKFTTSKNASLEDQAFQIGSGSTDYIINAAYSYTKKNLVLAAATSYKYNTANADGFRFGDIFNASVTAAYKIDLKATTVRPYLQLKEECFLPNANKHILQQSTGGNVVSALAGADINFKRLTFGGAFTLPLFQSLAEGNIKVRPGCSAHISVTL